MIALLVMLSIILTVSVLFPDATNESVILGILGGGAALGLMIALATVLVKKRVRDEKALTVTTLGSAPREEWRMPPLAQLPPARLSLAAKAWMFVLRAYLVVAGGLVLLRIVALAFSRG